MFEKVKSIVLGAKNNGVCRGKKRNADGNNGISEVKSIMADEISACKQLDYMHPKEIADWVNNAGKRFREIFIKTKADSYNASMVDKLIDNQIDLAILSIQEQHAQHISAIKEIIVAQKSRIATFEKRLAKYDIEINEIKKTYPDIPTTDISQMSKIQKSKMPFYKKQWCLFLILGVSCVLDYTTIESAVDALLTQNIFLSTLLSIGTAMLINVTPSIAGVYAKNKKADNRKFVLLLLGAIFFNLFAILFGLRWATKDILFTDTSLLFESAGVSDQNTMAEIFMTVLLSVEPALTSALSFVFGYIGASEEEKEKELAEIHLAELYLLKSDLEIRIEELREVVKENQNMSDEEVLYAAQLDLMEQYRLHFKEMARIELSQLIAKPEGNGIILQRENAISFEY
jgi:hypothetical protein